MNLRNENSFDLKNQYKLRNNFSTINTCMKTIGQDKQTF